MICTIELCGCDATTTFRTELNETEVALLQRIAEMSRKNFNIRMHAYDVCSC